MGLELINVNPSLILCVLVNSISFLTALLPCRSFGCPSQDNLKKGEGTTLTSLLPIPFAIFSRRNNNFISLLRSKGTVKGTFIVEPTLETSLK